MWFFRVSSVLEAWVKDGAFARQPRVDEDVESAGQVVSMA